MAELVFTGLTDDDLRSCFDLCMSSLHENTDWEDAKNAWELCRSDPHYRFIVGKLDGKVAAFAAINIFHTLFDGVRPICTVWYVCVDETLRRHGIGRQLFAEIERIAEENNCLVLGLSCLKDNIEAAEFYRSIGYSDEKETAFVKYYF